ncbi:MAG: hypothetical protein ACRC46_00905 [Thermoguttaceae bacterium]
MKTFTTVLVTAFALVCTGTALAQGFDPVAAAAAPATVPAATPAVVASSPSPVAAPAVLTPDEVLGQRIANVTRRKAMSNEQGQFYREYDITPYTKSRSLDPSTTPPQQTIVDWILRQTTPNVWHSQTECVLAATPEKLYVYHQIDVQKVVADIVDRFVSSTKTQENYTMRVLSLGRPDWVTRGHVYLQPIPIQTPGVQGWLIDKVNVPRFLADISRRSDYRDYTSVPVNVPNGMRYEFMQYRPRQYTRDVQPSAQMPGYVSDVVTIQEGFRLRIVPLSCLDGETADLTIDGDFTQIDRMNSIPLELVGADGSKQRHNIESPQLVTFKFDEQLRFPKGKVLLLDLGMWGALEGANASTSTGQILTSLTRVVAPTTGRVNYLMLLECQDQRTVAVPTTMPTPLGVPATTATAPTPTYWPR